MSYNHIIGVNLMKEIIMTFRELIEILELDKIAPIHFQKLEDISKNNYVFFRYLGNEEKKALINGTHDENKRYDNSDLGVYLPDIDIKQCYIIETKRNPFSISYVNEQISYKMGCVWTKELYLVWSLYCALHEVGHWLDFVNSGKTSYEFSIMEKGYREEIDREAEMLYNMNDYFPQKRILAEEYVRKYYEIPSEKAANDYAFSNFVPALNKVREKLGYTTDDL